jgi:hypothetical protein
VNASGKSAFAENKNLAAEQGNPVTEDENSIGDGGRHSKQRTQVVSGIGELRVRT